jgi:uncharacterized coiled-coil DUF342 family protein
MKPENRKLREKAILQIVALFIISVIVVVLLLHFSSVEFFVKFEDETKKSLDDCLEQSEKFEGELKTLKSDFSKIMNEVSYSMDTMWEMVEREDQVEEINEIKVKIGIILDKAQIITAESSDTALKELYANIIRIYRRQVGSLKTITDLKNETKKSGDVGKQLALSKEEEDRLNIKIAELRETNNDLKAANNSSGGDAQLTPTLQAYKEENESFAAQIEELEAKIRRLERR